MASLLRLMPQLEELVMLLTPAAAAPVGHVRARDLALALDEDAAHLWHTAREILGDVVLRRYRVAREEAAAGPDGGLGHGLAALHENLLSHQPTSL